MPRTRATESTKDVTPSVPPKSSPAKSINPTYIKYYLIAYNALSSLGWAYVLVLTIVHLFDLDGASAAIPVAAGPTASSRLSQFLSSIPFLKSAPIVVTPSYFESKLPVFARPLYHRTATTFGRVGTSTALVQSLATLEIAHVLLGFVRSALLTTILQVFSRMYLVWGIMEQYGAVRSSPFYTLVVISWSLTEVVRYSFYAVNLLGYEPYPLLYLRYTTFYVLYPLGALSEDALIYASLPKSSPVPSVSSWVQGMWTPYDYLRGLFAAVWPFGLYLMFTHMMAQRRKALSTITANGKAKIQ